MMNSKISSTQIFPAPTSGKTVFARVETLGGKFRRVAKHNQRPAQGCFSDD
jgi:hypothetical protein